MLSNTPPQSTRHRTERAAGATLTSLVAFPLVLIALLLAASYPLAAVTLLAVGVVAAKGLQIGLAAFVRRTGSRIRQLTIPGVGTVEYRITPR